jgi:sulfhydrogenase subunit delta
MKTRNKKSNKKPKLKVGIFGVSGCAGCLLSIIYEDTFKKLNEIFDVCSFPLIKENSYKGRFDLVFIEGTVCSDEDIVMLNDLRKRSKTVVALGSCAVFGGVPSIKNFHDSKKIMGFVYPKLNQLKSERPTPLSEHIKVDYSIPQCPPDKEEIMDFIISIMSGKIFKNYKNPVCQECRKKGNLCLLEKNQICLGPVTRGGCKALCPSNGVTCYGCRGPTKDANYPAYVKMLNKKGHTNAEIKDKLQTFAGLDFQEDEKEKSAWLEE